ncbi:MAG: hypothetical protein DWQ02_26095 [Bacteroidetes bacterium]|nr:MAG: hypothetical protein DWQ02_26095 [Bacteroidota bacterium]
MLLTKNSIISALPKGQVSISGKINWVKIDPAPDLYFVNRSSNQLGKRQKSTDRMTVIIQDAKVCQLNTGADGRGAR